MDLVGHGATELQSLEAAGELLRGEVGELVQGQGEGVLSLGVLLHVLLDKDLVVGVHLEIIGASVIWGRTETTLAAIKLDMSQPWFESNLALLNQ